jgi:diguanylate cyclase
VVVLFILSALVPLGLCSAILFREFSAELSRSEQRSLDNLIRSFGMTVIARLGIADDDLTVVTQTAYTDEEARASLSRLGWVHGQVRVEPPATELSGLPAANERQTKALRRGSTVVLWSSDTRGHNEVYLVRALRSRAWLYVALDPEWLWGNAADFAEDSTLWVLDDRNRVLSSAGSEHVPLDFVDGRQTSNRWTRRSWEMFLAGRFASPSWWVVAVRTRPALLAADNGSYFYLCGLILITLLLITWLSLTSIRRQLRPLTLLREATERVAHRDFKALTELSRNDEFGDLARSFDAMSAKLKSQFAALETLAEVDRLLLSAPDLELILDRLLPRIADLLGCQSVSVLLFDADSGEHARAYDYYTAQSGQLPVRRTAGQVKSLREICERAPPPVLDAVVARHLDCLPPRAPEADRVRLFALKNEAACVGALCLGYGAAAADDADAARQASDFADRLSLILAKLAQSARLHQEANFDSLTGLQNRKLFSDSVALAVAGGGRGGVGALLYIDLDHFKRVNDTSGHAAGDSLLRIAAQRLKMCAGEGCSIARLGGDEFAVLLPVDADAARQIAERIIVTLRTSIEIDGREHHISASIGMAVFPADGTTLEQLLRAADISMYHAKDAGRGRAVFFQAEMQQRLLDRFDLEDRMRRALLNSDFALHYQPIVDSTSTRKIGVEALARWPRADGPWIGPAVFIPIAESNGLIVELGDWILRRACTQFAEWRHAGVPVEYVSVNVSVHQLTRTSFVQRLERTLLDSGVRPDQLQIEITESVLAHASELRDTLAGIVTLGVHLALDDFGTGYSSLSYLRQYPVGTVKIDRSFVVGLPHEALACSLVEAIVHMCAALGKTVVAEGIETEAQQQFMQRIGCDVLQGYLLGRPMEAADIPGFARRLLSGPAAEAAAAEGRALASAYQK